MARLDKLCSEENSDAEWNENERKRRVNLFEWVVGTNSYPRSR